jgi:hypothetical protein
MSVVTETLRRPVACLGVSLTELSNVRVIWLSLASAGGLILTVLIVTSFIHRARRNKRARQCRFEKAATYQTFIQVWRDLCCPRLGAPSSEPAQRDQELLALDQLIMMYGNAPTIRAYSRLRKLERTMGGEHPAVKAGLSKVLITMRLDLGSSADDITTDDLQRLLNVNSNEITETGPILYSNLSPLITFENDRKEC